MYRPSGSFSSVATATTSALAKHRLSFSFLIVIMPDYFLQNVSKLEPLKALFGRKPTDISHLKKLIVTGPSRTIFFPDCYLRSKMFVITVVLN